METLKRSRPRPGQSGPPGAAPGKGSEGSTAKLVLYLAIGLAAIFGPHVYFASAEKQDTRNLMRKFCGSNQPCRDAVVEHFDSCWSSNSRWGLGRRHVQIDREGLVDCVNEAAGVTYFTYNEEKDYISTPDP